MSARKGSATDTLARLRAAAAADRPRATGEPVEIQSALATPVEDVPPKRQPPTDEGSASRTEGWEQTHKRVMVYFPRPLLTRIQREAQRSGLSKTQWMVAAAEEKLAVSEGKR